MIAPGLSIPIRTARRPGGTSRLLRRYGAAAFLLLACAAAFAVSSAQTFRRLEWTYVPPDPLAHSESEGGGNTFGLPLTWSNAEGSALHYVSLRLDFDLDAPPTQTWALYLARDSEGGRVSVNGSYIGTIADETESRHVAWRRPQLLSIDPSLLVAGTNVVRIDMRYGPGNHALGGIEVGPHAQLWNRYAVRFFLAWTVPWSGAAFALLTAALFGAMWWRWRESVPRLLMQASAFWLLYALTGVVEIMPVELRMAVSILSIAAYSGFCATLAVAMMRLSALARPREEWLVWAYAALGPVLALATSLRADSLLQQSWQPGLVLIIATATGVGLMRRTRGQNAPHPLILAGTVIFICAALLDVLSNAGFNPLLGAQALALAGPLVLLALAAPLLDGIIRTTKEADAARAELETRVREREQLLKRNFERLRESERVKAEAQERQRIMQDMHDGLGSQLMSSLMLVERGAVSNDQFAQILRESIDDMRLAIDALASEDADLAAALGNLRFRMEPRLRAAGMELVWDARALPEELGLHPDVVLRILRIVQEALTNALKHSRAKMVRVTLATEGTGDGRQLDIRVSDNGRGIAEERVGGRGLLNMRNRAQKIGAQLKLETAPNVGTTVHLRTRIGPSVPTTRTHATTVLNTQAIIERVRQQ